MVNFTLADASPDGAIELALNVPNHDVVFTEENVVFKSLVFPSMPSMRLQINLSQIKQRLFFERETPFINKIENSVEGIFLGIRIYYVLVHLKPPEMSKPVMDLSMPIKSSPLSIGPEYGPLLGGGKSSSSFFYWYDLKKWLVAPDTASFTDKTRFIFITHYSNSAANDSCLEMDPDTITCVVPVSILARSLSRKSILTWGRIHIKNLSTRMRLSALRSLFDQHQCTYTCAGAISLFALKSNDEDKFKQRLDLASVSVRGTAASLFPPSPCSNDTMINAINGFCNASSIDMLREKPCSVCGILTPDIQLDMDFKKYDINWSVLRSHGVAPIERKKFEDPLHFHNGPLFWEDKLICVCSSCLKSLKKNETPVLSLANGNWIGEIPSALQNLRLVEKLLIARYRHNVCVVKVQSGQKKMRANAIVFSHPTPIYYHVLPPPRADMDEVLAVLFVGPCKPTPDDLKRTPLLVRHEIVYNALTWLKANHRDYHDLNISLENLKEYDGDLPPVPIVYTQGDGSVPVEAQSVYDKDEDPGTEEGICPFAVQGLTGAQLSEMPYRHVIAEAVKHLKSGNRILAISHSKDPESIWNNPSLYPCLFPWLFPYGYGGFDSPESKKKVPHKTRKRQLLLYGDDRFRVDEYFAVVAFNHEQIKDSSWSAYLLSRQSHFHNIIDKVMSLDTSVLTDMIERAKDGNLRPENNVEKEWFNLMDTLHLVAGQVQGSNSGRRFMRSQLWSLIYNFSCPNWFITFAPNDIRHPICLYYAGLPVDLDKYEMILPEYQARVVAICRNPVAGARFFHLMVTLFIKHILGFGNDKPGVFGDIAHYYGTVEAQGRLTLHLHMLIWVKGGLTVKDIRDRLKAKDTEFECKLVQYLESAHKGEFITGSMTVVKESIANKYGKSDDGSADDGNDDCLDPTMTLPVPFKESMTDEHVLSFKKDMFKTVDEIVYKVNRHTHRANCLKNGCSARFPRVVHEITTIDRDTGAIIMKKGESWINTYNETLTYLLRCNTDVTSLMSGTAVRAVVAYVTDYVSKSTLSTHTMWAVVQTVFDRFAVVLNDKNKSTSEKVRSLLTRVVNGLSAKQELGLPMICMYLLGHPDHYTSERFVNFNWTHYLSVIRKDWPEDVNNIDKAPQNKSEPTVNGDLDESEPILISRIEGQIKSISKSQDYIYRPDVLGKTCLYDFVRLFKKTKSYTKSSKSNNIEKNIELDTITRESTDIDTDDGDDDDVSEAEDGDSVISDMENNSEDDDPDATLIPKISCRKNCKASVSSNVEADTLNTIQDSYSSFDSKTLDDVRSDRGGGRKIENSLKSVNMKRKHEVTSSGESDLYESDVPVSKNKHTDTSSGRGTLYFKLGHPQKHTHKLTLSHATVEACPNFTGGMLPRRDKGFRDKYCMTMLMLFKPWRSGRDLKLPEETWDEAFTNYQFSPRAEELMDYFDSLYQCQDARDDLSQKRKGNKEFDIDGLGISTKDMDDIELENEQAMIIDGLRPDDHIAQLLDHVDFIQLAKERISKQRADDLRKLLYNNGWSRHDLSTTNNSHLEAVNVFVTGEGKSKFHWRNVLDNARQLLIDARDALAPKDSPARGSFAMFKSNTVKIVNEAWLCRGFVSKQKSDIILMNTIVVHFTLRTEQERAFRIVANHSTSLQELPLNMYLGGMAGTGKSQVIKALVFWFKERKEEYRFMLLAPTGAAAAIIGGSTYHSVLGFREGDDNKVDTSLKTLAKVLERLKHREYVFFDECSMMPCNAVYRISHQMCNALGNSLDPFGGMNIIFAGDFAQLKPPGGNYCLYSHKVSAVINSRKAYKEQIESMGKALWHGFTTVVLLKENMRQTVQSSNDAKFRSALENMRYGSCTPDDISILRTAISKRTGNKSLSNPNFRDVSIITALNKDRDTINYAGCKRYASDNNVELHHFYSLDVWSGDMIANPGERVCKSKRLEQNPKRSSNKLSKSDQYLLWDLTPEKSDHFAGRLSLSIGMPVLLKKNMATELGVTNGAEAIVVGWKSKQICKGHQNLEILFVELKNSNKEVQLDNLPKNVVPIAPLRRDIHCTVNSNIFKISRTQVPVLPNFAMTDYSSQGRTRYYNIVDLSNCASHQSFYTCLSRGTSIDQTLILQGFDDKKITSGAAADLRSEFRALEILNDITKRKYENNLDPKVKGFSRVQLIQQYLNVYGQKKVPKGVHRALDWSNEEMIKITEEQDASDWTVIENGKKKHESNNKNGKKIKLSEDYDKLKIADEVPGFVPALGSSPLSFLSKDHGFQFKNKKNCNNRVPHLQNNKDGIRFQNYASGLPWNSNSCAYDAIVSILFCLYCNKDKQWFKNMVEKTNSFVRSLGLGFSQILDGKTSLENIRNRFRRKLCNELPAMFRMGAMTSLPDLCRVVASLNMESMRGELCLKCSECGHVKEKLMRSGNYFIGPVMQTGQSITSILNGALNKDVNGICSHCNKNNVLIEHVIFEKHFPGILTVLLSRSDFVIDWHSPIRVTDFNGNFADYGISGIVYYGSQHFTSRFIDYTNCCWYHDGIASNGCFAKEIPFSFMLNNELMTCKGKKASVFFLHLM